MRSVLFLLFCVSASLFAALSQEEGLSRIRAHLLLSDPVSAMKEAEVQRALFPDSQEIAKCELICMARSGRAGDAYRRLNELEATDDLELVEEVAWSFLCAAEHSAQIPVVSSSLIGNYLTRDVRAVKALMHSMRSSNAGLRMLAVRLGAAYGDAVLVDTLEAMLGTEQVWYVKLEIIRALGHLRVKSSAEKLEAILSQSEFAEEKVACVGALVTFYDDVTEEQVDLLLESKSSGLRLLGLQLLIHFDKNQWREKCLRPLMDHSVDVRCAALTTLGMLGMGELEFGGTLATLLEEDLYPVNVHAAWLLLKQNRMEGYRHLYRMAMHGDDKLRRLAAASIASSGVAGELLAEKLLKESSDPYVKVNIALHMLGGSIERNLTTKQIFNFLDQTDEKIMFEYFPGSFFTAVAPSQVRHSPHVAQYPLLVDQMVRLQLYSALAVVKAKGSEKLIAKFLDRGMSEVVQAASMTLLQEGSREALDQVKELLQDESLSDTVKLGATLVLAYAGEEEAFDQLKSMYFNFGRMEKLMIIEALASVKGQKSLSFLISLLDEHAHILRIASASAIIQSLRN